MTSASSRPWRRKRRLALYRLLAEAGSAGLPAGEIAERLAVAAPTLSFHLKELSHDGLVGATPRGRFVVYRADFDAMNALIGYLTENCGWMGCDAECAPVSTASTTPKNHRNTPRRRMQ